MDGHHKHSKSSPSAFLKQDWPGILLIVMLAAFWLMGGASRADVSSLIVIRPLGMAAFVIGLACLTFVNVRKFWPLLVICLGIILIIGVQLIPLPADTWATLPGRSLFVEIATATGFDYAARPITLMPTMSRNAYFAAFLPAAILLLFMASSWRMRSYAFQGVLIFACLSALLGLMQIIGPAGGNLYFFDITNDRSPVGLLANRNHQGILLACVPPLLFSLVISAKRRISMWAGLAAGLWLVCGLLVIITGSRGGTILFGLSTFLSFLMLPKTVSNSFVVVRKYGRTVFYAIPIGIMAIMAAITVFSDRSEAFNRIIGTETQEENRLDFVATALEMTKDFFPFGAGAGTFSKVFRIYEPDNIMSDKLVNHAHNDFVEIAYAYGLPGILLTMFGLIMFVYYGIKAWSKPMELNMTLAARASSIGLLVLIIASVFEYPLRTPSLASVAVLFAATLLAVLRPSISPLIVHAEN